MSVTVSPPAVRSCFSCWKTFTCSPTSLWLARTAPIVRYGARPSTGEPFSQQNLIPGYADPERARSSAGQSRGLIIPWSLVRIQAGPFALVQPRQNGLVVRVWRIPFVRGPFFSHCLHVRFALLLAAALAALVVAIPAGAKTPPPSAVANVGIQLAKFGLSVFAVDNAPSKCKSVACLHKSYAALYAQGRSLDKSLESLWMASGQSGSCATAAATAGACLLYT